MIIKSSLIKNRLIWKIMLIFWITTSCTILANIFITKEIVLTEYKIESLREKMRGLTIEAVEIYETNGKRSLKRWYRKLLKREGIRVVLLDKNHNILAQPAQNKRHFIPNHDEPDKHRDSEEHKDSGKQRDSYQIKQRALGLGGHLLKPADQQIVASSGKAYILRILPSPYLRSKFSARSLHAYRLTASFIIIFIGSWWLARSVAKPVNILRQASEQVAEGKLNIRVSPLIGARKDELGQLGRAFDNMASKIESLLSGQRQLFRDISHDIRTPLTRQMLAIELAKDTSDPTQLLIKIEQQNQVIEDLVNNLLSLMQLEDSQRITFELVNLENIINSVVNAAEITTQNKKIIVNVSIHGSLQIFGDPALLTRALDNLLVNAINYSPENSTIAINAFIKDKHVQVDLQDQGPGIPEQDLEHILSAFYKVDKSRTKKHGGYGLGLAITDKIIQQHDGEVLLENVSPQGLRVSLKIPKK